MRSRSILVVGSVAVIAALLWREFQRRPPSMPRGATPASAVAAAVELAPAPEPPQRRELAAGDEAPAPVAAAPSTRGNAPSSKLSEIRGRFVFPGGAPAAGATFELHGWESNDDEVRKYGRPEHWEDSTGVTDADGRCAVRFDPPRAYQFTFEVKAAGHAGAEWRWGSIAAGKVIDLGEIELPLGGTIEGRIVDADGNAVPGAWTLYARSVGLGEFDGRDETQVMVDADLSGRFRVEDVMPGRVELRAHDSRWTESTVIQVHSGEVVEADIVVARREVARSVRVEAHSRWLYALGPEAEHVSLTAEDGSIRKPTPADFDIVFEDVEPGSYTLAIDDPRFRPWSCKVRPGAEVEAVLEGTSALAPRVHGPKGELLGEYGLHLQLRNVNFAPCDFDVIETRADRLNEVVAGLTAGDYRIIVQAGELRGMVDVDGLAIGETRSVDVFLGPERALSGHIRYSDGTAADGVKVGLLPATSRDTRASELFDGSAWRLELERDAEKQEAGPGGSFRFPVLVSGEYVVIAAAPNGSEVVSEVLTLEAGAKGREIELVLPRGGSVSGRVLAPEGASCAGLRLWIGTEKSTGLVDKTCRELAADGSFEIGPLAPGKKTAFLLLPVQLERWEGGTMGADFGDHKELGEIEIVDGVHLEHDFEGKEFPGTVTLDVLVNGEAVAGVQVELLKGAERSFDSVLGSTDRNGTFGPAQAFSGQWDVMAYDRDAGWWCTRLAPVSVETARASRARIQIQVAEAALLFLDATTGEPLVQREIAVLGSAGQPAGDHAWQRQTTDARGRVRWKLAAGEYRFRLQKPGESPFPDFQESGEPQRVAPILWTDAGPLVHEVRL